MHKAPMERMCGFGIVVRPTVCLPSVVISKQTEIVHPQKGREVRGATKVGALHDAWRDEAASHVMAWVQVAHHPKPICVACGSLPVRTNLCWPVHEAAPAAIVIPEPPPTARCALLSEPHHPCALSLDVSDVGIEFLLEFSSIDACSRTTTAHRCAEINPRLLVPSAQRTACEIGMRRTCLQ
jgi:hypothetical protein